MDQKSFNQGMICGLKTALKIIDEAVSDFEIVATINGAIVALENADKQAKDE